MAEDECTRACKTWGIGSGEFVTVVMIKDV